LLTKSTLPNLFDLCPPFQIDGNLGGPAAITEMLVQSTAAEISVLPALPQQWPNGSLKGVRVRGGGKVNITWKEGRLTELRLQSDHAKKYTVSYGDKAAEAQIEPGKPFVLNGALRRIVQ
jgi:alpha-L-fucosidase 2